MTTLKNSIVLMGEQPVMKSPTKLLWLWKDVLKLFPEMIELLFSKLEVRPIALMTAANHYILEGVAVEENMAFLPETMFWYGKKEELLILLATPPQMRWYRYIHDLLVFAKERYGVSELYTFSVEYSQMHYSEKREVTSAFGDSMSKEVLKSLKLKLCNDFIPEDEERHRYPTLSDCVAWLAPKFDIASCIGYVRTPLCLSPFGDPYSAKVIVAYLNHILKLDLEPNFYNSWIEHLKKFMIALQKESVDAADLLERLKDGESLSDEENQLLLSEIKDFRVRYSEA